MHIGILRERKTGERRVALTPAACAELVGAGHALHVERGAGQGSGHADADYAAAGAELLPDAAAVCAASRLLVKVKEPLPEELPLLRAEHVLFCFLHLAAFPELTRALLRIGLTAIGFETVRDADGRLPLLAPMSAIAGRLAVQLGARYLEAHGAFAPGTETAGGKGLLLGGIAGTGRGHVVVIGAGVAGSHAARYAAALGARVTVFDRDPAPLAALHEQVPDISGLVMGEQTLARALADADLLVSAVLVPAARAPQVIDAALLDTMPRGGVAVDVAVDQGGSLPGTRVTNWDAPAYIERGLLRSAVPNLPGAVPVTATAALSAALLPYVAALAAAPAGWPAALEQAVYLRGGQLAPPGEIAMRDIDLRDIERGGA